MFVTAHVRAYMSLPFHSALMVKVPVAVGSHPAENDPSESETADAIGFQFTVPGI